VDLGCAPDVILLPTSEQPDWSCMERTSFDLGEIMRVIFLFAALVGFSSPTLAQTCDQVCDDYKSFARRAGTPQTLEPLLKLYRACMECSKGAGSMACDPAPNAPPNSVRCQYNPTNNVPPFGQR